MRLAIRQTLFETGVDARVTTLSRMESKGIEGEVLKIGASEGHSVNEIDAAILKALGKPKSLLKTVPDRPGHVQQHAVDTVKIRSGFAGNRSDPLRKGSGKPFGGTANTKRAGKRPSRAFFKNVIRCSIVASEKSHLRRTPASGETASDGRPAMCAQRRIGRP